MPEFSTDTAGPPFGGAPVSPPEGFSPSKADSSSICWSTPTSIMALCDHPLGGALNPKRSNIPCSSERMAAAVGMSFPLRAASFVRMASPGGCRSTRLVAELKTGHVLPTADTRGDRVHEHSPYAGANSDSGPVAWLGIHLCCPENRAFLH